MKDSSLQIAGGSVANAADDIRVADAVREKLEACVQLDYLNARAARGSRDAYERVLAKVPAAAPIPGDERNPSGLSNDGS